LAISPNGTWLYDPDGLPSSTVGALINTSTNAITPIPIDVGVQAAFSPDSSKLYISTPNSVVVVDTATGKTLGTISLPGNGGAVDGSGTGAAVFTPDGKKAYIGNESFNGNVLVPSDVAVIDTATMTVTNTLLEGLTPDRIAITPFPDANGKYYLYVLNIGYVNNNTQVNLDIIDTSDDTKANSVVIASFPGTTQNPNNASWPVIGFGTIKFSDDNPASEAYIVGAAEDNTTNCIAYIFGTAQQNVIATIPLNGQAIWVKEAIVPLRVTTP
jgi:hypothetical protein